MQNLLDRILGRLHLYDASELACFLFAALGVAFAVWALVRKRELGGLVAMLLASLAAGAGVLVQVRDERNVEQSLTDQGIPSSRLVGHLRLLGPRATRASIERQRREIMPLVQVRGQRSALAALLPLVLGAIAALWSPRGSRVLAGGFLGLSALVCLGALVISHRPVPLDRYAFEGNDDDAWGLAIALDEAADPDGFNLRQGSECLRVQDALDRYWGATDRTEWPRVMRKPVPPELVTAVEPLARGCVIMAIAEMKGEPEDARALRRKEELLGSVLLQDEALHASVIAWVPPTAEERAATRAALKEAFRGTLARMPGSFSALEWALGLDGGQPPGKPKAESLR